MMVGVIGHDSTAVPLRNRSRRLLFEILFPGLLGGLIGMALNAAPVPLGFGLHYLAGGVATYFTLYLFGGNAAILAASVAGAWTWYAWGHPWGWVLFTLEAIVVVHLARRGRTVIVASALYWLCIGVPIALVLYAYGTSIDVTSITLIIPKQALNGIANAATGYLLGMGVSWLASGRRLAAPNVRIYAFLAYLFVGFSVVPAFGLLFWHAQERQSTIVQETMQRSLAKAVETEEAIAELRREVSAGMPVLAAMVGPRQPGDAVPVEGQFFNLLALSPAIHLAVDHIGIRDPDGLERTLWARDAAPADWPADRPADRDVSVATRSRSNAAPDRPSNNDAYFQVSTRLATSSGGVGVVTAVFNISRYVAWARPHGRDGVEYRLGVSATELYETEDGTNWSYTAMESSTGRYVLSMPKKGGNQRTFLRWSDARIGVLRDVSLSGSRIQTVNWVPLYDLVEAYRKHLRGLIVTLLGIVVLALVTAMLIGRRVSRLFAEVQEAIVSLPDPDLPYRPRMSHGIREIDRMFESVAATNVSLISEIRHSARLERRLDQLRRFAPMAIYALERTAGGEWTLVYHGPAMRRLMGVGDCEDIRMEPFLQRVHPKDRTAAIASWRRFLRTGSLRHEFRIRGTDGKYRWVYNELARIDEECTPDYEYAIGTIADINQRKENARRLKDSSKLITLGEMATGMAHELNQPLNVIRLAAENLDVRVSRAALPADLQGYIGEKLARISAQTRRAAQIIDHMRIFGRRPADRPEPFQVEAAIDGVLTMTAAQLRVAGIELGLDVAAGLPPVIGNQQLLEQVIINLVLNAKDAVAEKIETVAADPATAPYPGMIRIAAKFDRRHDRLTVRVADNGPGIPHDIRSRIFEPFFTTKPVGKGTGLGLSVSYGIVVEMGGGIDVASGRSGTVFRITLPVAAPDAMSAIRAADKASGAGTAAATEVAGSLS